MKASRILKTGILGLALLAGSVTVPWAFCNSSIETYALFHCGPRAYVEAVPGGFTPQDVTGVFWQFGFGNMSVNTGLGNDGTGFASKAFNGNDSGQFPVDILDAAATFPTQGFPTGSVCLGSNDWANSGVDGCCDNTRPSAPFNYNNNYDGLDYTNSYPNDDNILNPYFGFFWATQNYPGYYSIASMMDYPTAVLLRLPGDAYFAIMSVSMKRDNTGGNGPCQPLSPGTNEAACDVRQGEFSYGNIVNGKPNVLPTEAGKMNAVPWQTARPREVSGLNCGLVDCGGATVPVRFEVPCVTIHSDEQSIPTNNPTMATRDATKPRNATRAAGVGTRDLKRKWNGLVRYTLESAPIVAGVNTDANGDILYDTLTFSTHSVLTPSLDANGNCTAPIQVPASGTMDIPTASCWRTRIDVGKAPEISTPSLADCRIGRCGDVGITIAQRSRSGVTCFGQRDPLASENIINASVEKTKGRSTVRWETTAELSVNGFDVFAVTRQGKKLVATVPCTECTTGAGASYEAVIRQGNVKGGVTSFEIHMKGGSGAVATAPTR